MNGRVDGVVDDLTALGENVDSKDGENVKYTAQNRTTAEKERARANIGAAPTENPVFTGELALGNGFGASVLFNVTTQGGVTALDFSQSRSESKVSLARSTSRRLLPRATLITSLAMSML